MSGSNIPAQYTNAYQQIGITLGQPYNIYRPNFNIIDQTPALIASGLGISVKPGGGKYAIPRIGGVDYFTIVGDRANFLPGDILIPQNTSSSIPPVTVLSYDAGLPAIGFMCSKTCNITLDLNTDVYTNVYFDYVLSTYPAEGLITELSGGADIQRKKIVVWTRTNFIPEQVSYAIQGMRIILTGGITPVRYVVKGINQIENLTVFSVEDEDT